MSSIIQPDGINDLGALVTIGVNVNSDRCSMVMPIYTDQSVTAKDLCGDVVTAVENSVLTPLLTCLSSSANVSYISAEAMVDGYVPYRRDYAAGVYVGLGSAGAVPSNVSALLVFYQDPTTVVEGERIRVGKTFVPGMAADQLDGDHVVGGEVDFLQQLADVLQNGFPVISRPEGNWYRCLAEPRPRTPGTAITIVTAQQARGYVCTQRRRLIPH